MDATEFSDDGFQELADKITRETNFRCANYKDKCLRRRILVRMRARGIMSFHAYAQLLDADSSEYSRLLDALTINVTKFFRNWTTFERMAQVVIPALWTKPGGIRVWSAGSASGEETYSIAALFYEHAVARGEESLLNRVEIIGSDIDRGSLIAADRAIYLATAFAETPPDVAERLFPRLGNAKDAARTVLPAIRSMVHFERRDLLLEPPPPRIFDLVVCRNVIIYFGRAAQDELFLKFHRALMPNGFLVLGRVETLLGEPRSLFKPVDLRERIFQRGEQR